jgi:hypothetical protein
MPGIAAGSGPNEEFSLVHERRLIIRLDSYPPAETRFLCCEDSIHSGKCLADQSRSGTAQHGCMLSHCAPPNARATL